MNRIVHPLILVVTIITPYFAQSQDYQDDVSSIDNIITALYASISGEKGEARDWGRFKHLFAEGALLTPTQDADTAYAYRQMTPGDYVQRASKWFNETGFFEEEIHRETEQFANIAHVFSTYASRHTAEGEIFMRGINSIQLFYDGKRWWVLSIYWAAESEKHPIPQNYLPE